MSVKTLADGNTKVTVLAAAPADKNQITVTELTDVGAKDASCQILKSDFDYGPTGSETIDEAPLCAEGNGQAPGLSNFGGGWSILRFWDPDTGLPDTDDDWLWDLVNEKGTTLYLVVRDSHKKSKEAWTAGDEYRYYEVVTDDPQRGDRTGYIKYRQVLLHQDAAIDKVVVAGP